MTYISKLGLFIAGEVNLKLCVVFLLYIIFISEWYNVLC